MGGDPIPGPLDEEHAIDALISDLKALHRAIPGILLALKKWEIQARREAASR